MAAADAAGPSVATGSAKEEYDGEIERRAQEAAAKKEVEHYIRLRQLATKVFYAFLGNLDYHKVSSLDRLFAKHGGNLGTSLFVRLFSDVLAVHFKKFAEQTSGLLAEDRQFVLSFAALTMFQDIDAAGTDNVSWIQFVEFVVAKSETLRTQSEVGCINSTRFDFTVSNIPMPHKPTLPKSTFDKCYYWPEHSADVVVVFEEGQDAYSLHRPTTIARRRRVEGHQMDLLAAEYLPDPFDWLVTCANDKAVRFWDSAFSQIKRWNLDYAVNTLCWCKSISALFAADAFTTRVRAWRLPSPMEFRELPDDKPIKHDRSLEFDSDHQMPVQALLWLGPHQTLATASLDKTVRLFDLVQLQRTHVLSGHTKGVTCLEYNPKLQMLLSGGFDNYISLWDPGAGVMCKKLMGHSCAISSIKAVPNTEYEVLSVDADAMMKLWDLRRLTCLQSFPCGDPQAERDGELEKVEPRALCPLSRDRVLVTGRRMVLLQRDAMDTRATADYPISALAFCKRKLEIVTAVNSNLRIWSALTGEMLTVHEKVMSSNITALRIGLSERRMFVGTECGQIQMLNYACGASLKTLVPHDAEVTQIECMVGKVLSLSTIEKMILIHDDAETKKGLVLKRIDLTACLPPSVGFDMGPILSMSNDGRNTIVATSEEGEVFWFNTDSAKYVSSSKAFRSEMHHRVAVPACCYLRSVPLIITADVESQVIFWSVQPLRPYDIFAHGRLSLSQGRSPQGSPTSAGRAPPGGATYNTTCLAMSTPEEENLFVGTEQGLLACVNIHAIVEQAARQRDGMLHRKTSDLPDVSSNHHAEESQLNVTLVSSWSTPSAHRGSIEEVVYCGHMYPAVLTLGSDCRVRMWDPATGEPLGALEQGSASGFPSGAAAEWLFPLDAAEQAVEDRKALLAAAPAPRENRPSSGGTPERSSATPPAAGSHLSASPPPSAPQLDVSRKTLASSRSEPGLRTATSGGLESTARKTRNSFNFDKAPPRYLKPTTRTGKRDREWFAGAFCPEYRNRGHLPSLQSGLARPHHSEKSEVVQAAQRLSNALGALSGDCGRRAMSSTGYL